MDHPVLCASHPPGRTARRPDRNRSSRESSWPRSGGCCHSAICQHRAMEARPRQTRLAMSRPRSQGRDRTRTPLVDRPGSQFGSAMPPPGGMGRDVRSPGCGYAHPERLLRGYPSVGGGFTNPSPVPIRLRGCPSLPSCLSLPVAFLWRSWRRESCCSCHPCLYQPWRPLQLSVALLVPPDLRPHSGA